MTKEEMINKAKEVQNPQKDYKIIYELLNELNIPFKKTTCSKCRKDYYNIILEELGLISDASEYSDFNGGWKYLRSQSVIFPWKGKRYIINQNTKPEIIEEFVKTHKGYFKKYEKNDE